MNLVQLTAWWDRRKSRERLLLIVLAVLAVAITGYTLLRPVRIQIADSRLRLAVAHAELKKLQQLAEERERASSERLRAREADLEARLTIAESEIHKAQIDLVDPQDMARQLSAILKKFPVLHVVGMASEQAAPVDPGEKDARAALTPETRRAMLYEHGLELTIEGRYLDLIAYLQELEHTPYKIYWRELELKVNTQGVPVTKIRFFTLSRGPTWLTL